MVIYIYIHLYLNIFVYIHICIYRHKVMYVLIYTFRFSEPYRPDPIRSDHSRLCQFPTRFGPDPNRSHPL